MSSSSSEIVEALKTSVEKTEWAEFVEVFDINGQFIGKYVGKRELVLKRLPHAGVYLLKSKNLVQKIWLK